MASQLLTPSKETLHELLAMMFGDEVEIDDAHAARHRWPTPMASPTP